MSFPETSEERRVQKSDVKTVLGQDREQVPSCKHTRVLGRMVETEPAWGVGATEGVESLRRKGRLLREGQPGGQEREQG